MTQLPRCIIITGRPGAGKTTLAKRLAQAIHMPMLSRDEIKEGYVQTFGQAHHELPPETNRIVTHIFFDTARSMLESGVSIVIEAAFQHKLWAEFVPGIIACSRPRIIVCDADPETCARRHLERGLADSDRERFHGDHRVAHYRQTGEMLPPGPWQAPGFDVPTLKIDTSSSIEISLPNVLQFTSDKT
ncbi:MAG: AAA family ATPase [Candidatus Sumerlaeota bacterium]